jgi:hypothetical protein
MHTGKGLEGTADAAFLQGKGRAGHGRALLGGIYLGITKLCHARSFTKIINIRYFETRTLSLVFVPITEIPFPGT